ncbi:UDP-glucose--hexose-1-phosphate uridylyltransferase [Fonticella tunisiensis]|uniref:Galactose-1-phosphate uridylyltransferase n=1 Tax=Fonticella tunisiensis TaxID=1096341 RepID=A0A4R7KPJ1_9CLOT|nr:UDP-glucose--hexose-1-phosphate uridylyltransferase [Fonticella tunisiensis]TDT56458.1 UTP-hexose-1-phosphate uridylyltransferase [Fonticella tunisiensis]
MRQKCVEKDIERLLHFGIRNNLIEEMDKIPVRNSLMDLFKIREPYSGDIDEEEAKDVNEILSNLLDYAYEAGIIPENTTTYRDLLDAKIMGLLMPRQSEVAKNFWYTAEREGIKKATDDFYKLSIASNYIRVDRTSKNIRWNTITEFGELEITINLSKPEKDPGEIAAAKLVPQSNYPKCLLCLENVGYAGRINHPARQNHRVIPVNIAGEQWYFQYSPYVYYNEHCILFYEKHVPMKISEKTFVRLFDFIEKFPHYFIGSNADLPIVGGSILSHEHFQGGRHVFSMERAPIQRFYKHRNYEEITVGIVKWPLSVIRLSGNNKEKLIEISTDILNKWRSYSDVSVDILAYTDKDGEKILHNTITPIVRKNKKGEFEIDLVLRNNRTTDEYPEGIFHPHRELHHIKKENIGLIEVMGLAVLPARLKTELKEIKNILEGKVYFSREMYNKGNALYKHIPFIEYLIGKYGTKLDENRAENVLKEEVGRKFLEVLLTCGVFKTDDRGIKAFNRFMNALGFESIN